MTAATVSRWARRFVAVAVVSLFLWQVAILADAPRQTEVLLGLYGFVLHVVFGKAYSLVPAYFDRELAWPRATAVHLPLSAAGVAFLTLASLDVGPSLLGELGAIAWTGGVAVFLATLAWTVRDNLTGAETGTSAAQSERRRVDRLANAFVPVALAYLALGTYETLAVHGLVPSPIGAYPPRATHLLGTGTAVLLVFAVGFRLLPRFLVAEPPQSLVSLVLPAGALGPVVLAASLPAGEWFRFGAVVESVAVVGFAVAYAVLFHRSDRDRVGLYAVLAGAVGGVLAVSLGLSFAFGGLDPALITAHRRLTLLGFLGLVVVGATFQFYPPNVGRWPACDDRTAIVVVGLLAAGALVGAGGAAMEAGAVEVTGTVLSLLGAVGYAYLIFGAFATRR